MDLNMKDFHQILGEYLRGQLFYAALELDLFSHLDEKIKAKDLTAKLDYHARNLEWMLLAMSSEGLICKEGDLFWNQPGATQYLSTHSPDYIGNNLWQRKGMMDLCHLVERVKYGPPADSEGNQRVYDFVEIAKASHREKMLVRVPDVLQVAEELFAKEQAFRFLDLGGGLGTYSAVLAKAYPQAKGTIFEDGPVAEAAKEFIEAEKLTSRIEVVSGNFLTDDIGKDYDLIIASGIFHFAKKELPTFLQKIAQALDLGGYLISMTKVASDDYQEPKGAMVRWLAGHVKGLDGLTTRGLLEQAFDESGLQPQVSKGEKVGIRVHRKER